MRIDRWLHPLHVSTPANPDAGVRSELRQRWPLPSHPRPIVIIGAGAIVRTAHLPAYRRLGFSVAGVFDIRPEAAHETARQFGIGTVFASLDEACATSGTLFDVAVPGGQIARVVDCLPRGAAVLVQKTKGGDLAVGPAL